MMHFLLQLTMFVAVVTQKVASAQNDCGNTSFSGSAGIVTSPNFPLPYSHNTSCTYSIDVGRNNSVLLKFLNFELESSSSDGTCPYDWLMITCNETNAENMYFGRRFCGATLPRTSLRFSNCPVVELVFFADSSVNRGGFAIAYNVSENGNFSDDESDLDCGKTLFTNSSGVVRLPENPTDYPAKVNCIYTISANSSSRIELDISSLQRSQLMDSFEDCATDNITVVCSSGLRTALNPLRSRTFCYGSFDYMYFEEQASEFVFSNCSVMKIFVHSSDYTYRQLRYLRDVNGIAFTVSNYDTECGTTSFTGSTGTVTSPKFPLSYAHNLNCFYSIDVDRTKTVSLDFLSFHLEGTADYIIGADSCSFDWLTVNCLIHGYVPDLPHLHNRKYCGQRSKPMTLNFTKCDSLTLNFVSDSSVAKGGFQIRYNITPTESSELNTTDLSAEGCGNTSFTGPVGYIASPRFPLSYPHNLSCVYSIDVDPTKTVALLFRSFSIEGVAHSSFLDRCMHDWLKISCLSNDSVSVPSYYWSRRYCGDKETPFVFGHSSCDSLTLEFVTDSSITSSGFQLRYRISSEDQPDCGDTSFSGPNGVITSPHYPYPYPHNMSCTYSIDVGRSKSVLLKFKNFYLEMPNSEDNCDDWLMISCKDTTKTNPNYYKKYCGYIQWTSSMRFVDCPSLVLEFVSDSSVRGSGFRIDYTVVEDSSSTEDSSSVVDCGTSLFTNSSGVISLPRNPKSYLATIDCTYTISANHRGYISVEGIYPWIPLLQSFQDCKTESLTVGCVREGEREIDPNTTKVFCRRGAGSYYSAMGSVVFGDCRTVKLSIHSYTYDNPETLQFTFSVHEQSAICGNTSFSASSGFVSSPSLSLHHQTTVNCLYTIDTGRINSVALYLYHLAFDNIFTGRKTSCDSNFLKISCEFNGVSVPHPHANRKLCSSAYDAGSISFPACRRVLLNYSSEYISHFMGFSMRYSLGIYDEECGNTSSIDGSNGFITSPRFPLSYRHNMNCLYTINGGQRTAILLSSISFSLDGTSNTLSTDSCYKDWLTINCLSDRPAIHGVPSSKRYCGNKTTPLELAFPNCEVVMMHFRSDSTVTGGGFEIRYTVIDTDSFCGVPVYGPPSGMISFPLNSTEYDNIFNCTYVINATEPSSISLTIWSINAHSSNGTNCQRDWLLINCVDGYTTLDHKVSQSTCDNLNSSTQLIFTSCSTVNVVYHKESVARGKAFRLEYTVTSNGNGVVNAHMKSGGQSGKAVGITLTVLVLIGAICLGVLWLFRRYREKNRPEMLIQASELERNQLEMEDDDTSKSGFGDFFNEQQNTSRYVPL